MTAPVTGASALPPPVLNATEISRLYARISWRLIPFLFLCYVCAYLDRVNIGFAKLQMSQALDFSETVYGLGAGIFFIGYFLFEVPSNLLLHRIGARRCIARIMILWGLISAAMAWVDSVAMFYTLRFLLGVAEAGFFPGVILYLTYWYPAARRGQVTALFVTAVAVSSVLGAPLSGAIMQHLDAVHGLAGWQWLFVLEGLPSVFVGFWALGYLDDGVAGARWLSLRERHYLATVLTAEQAAVAHHRAWEGLRTPRVWRLCLVYFSFVLGLYGLNFWLPTMIKELGYTDLVQIGLISAIPFGAAALVMVAVSRHADFRQERRWHIAIPALCGAAGLLASVALAKHPVLALVALTVGTCGIFTAIPQTWTIATTLLAGSAAAVGIAFINSVGNLSGFVAPYAMGWLKDATGGTALGICLIAAFQVIGAGLVLGIPRKSITPSAGRN